MMLPVVGGILMGHRSDASLILMDIHTVIVYCLISLCFIILARTVEYGQNVPCNTVSVNAFIG